MSEEQVRTEADRKAPLRNPTPRESALYTYDMLVSLEKLAVGQKQAHLAALLQRAAAEARAIADGSETKHA
jgi:hypothetical protein